MLSCLARVANPIHQRSSAGRFNRLDSPLCYNYANSNQPAGGLTITTARSKSRALSSTAAADMPWYELIDDAPEPPEDAMQQAGTILYVMSILMARYKNDRMVLVSEQTNVIYDSAVPGSVIVPDGYIVFGVDTDTIETYRRSYRLDEWGVPPAFVLEVASESTARRDLTEKRALYAQIGVTEYWRLDKHGYYGEPLVGEHLVNGEYARYELHTEPNGDTWSRSEVLGVDFYHRVEDGVSIFPLRDSATGEWLGDLGEEVAAHAQTESARQAAEARAQSAEQAQLKEREARLATEARTQELQAELERLRRSQ